MNNKGFGLGTLLLFIAFVFVVLIIFYMVVSSFLSSVLGGKKYVPNYKNEYTVYMKQHHIDYNSVVK